MERSHHTAGTILLGLGRLTAHKFTLKFTLMVSGSLEVSGAECATFSAPSPSTAKPTLGSGCGARNLRNAMTDTRVCAEWILSLNALARNFKAQKLNWLSSSRSRCSVILCDPGNRPLRPQRAYANCGKLQNACPVVRERSVLQTGIDRTSRRRGLTYRTTIRSRQ